MIVRWITDGKKYKSCTWHKKQSCSLISQQILQISTVPTQQKACPCHKENQELNWQIRSTITGIETAYKILKQE